MKQQTWAEKSIIAICGIIEANPQTPSEKPAAYRKRIRTILDEQYPFAARSGFAWSIYNREKMTILRRLGIEKPRARKLTGDQMELFQ